jgi:hypothetical protein
MISMTGCAVPGWVVCGRVAQRPMIVPAQECHPDGVGEAHERDRSWT